jgi:hypothetical protein
MATIDDVGGALTREHVAALSRSLREHGYAYLRGIGADFDHPAEILRLGECMPQYQGQLIRDVKPDPVMEKAEVSANNMKPGSSTRDQRQPRSRIPTPPPAAPA